MKKNFKKLFLLVAVVATIAVCFAFSVGAIDETGKCGENVYWNYNSETKELVISGTGPMYDYEVYELENYIYEYVSTSPVAGNALNSLVIEDGVTSVGAYAFFDTTIKSIVIADTVTSINEGAFKWCYAVGSIDFGEGVKTIGKEAFQAIEYYGESIVFPDSLETIGEEAFAYIETFTLTEINITENVREISPKSFYLNKLEKFTVDENNQYYSADENGVIFNKGKTKLVLCPEAMKAEAYTVPDGVTEIGTYAFYGAKNIKEVSFPESLEVIGPYAFGNTDISEIFITSGVKELKNAFVSNSAEKFTVDEANPYYSNDEDGVLYNKDKTVLFNYPSDKSDKNLYYTIADSVKTIEENAFRYVTLKVLVIPTSVTCVKKNATKTANCYVGYTGTMDQWQQVEVEEGNDTLKSNSKYLFCEYEIGALGRPDTLTAKSSSCAVSLEWSEVFDADGYRIFRKTEDGWKYIGARNYTRDYTARGLKPSTTYTFAVQAGKKIDGKVVMSKKYAEITITTKIAPPEKITYTSTKNSVTLTWTPCEGATGYRIYREVEYSNPPISYDTEVKWVVDVSSTKATTYTLKNLYAGAIYTYAVRPYVKNGTEVEWGDYTVVEAKTKIDPVKVTATQSTAAIKLIWNNAGTDGYGIYYKSGKNWKLLGKGRVYSYTINGLKAGAKYTFAVLPYDETEDGITKYEYTQITTATKPATPTVKASSPSKGKVTVNWNAVNGAEGYQLWYKKGNGGYKLHKTYKEAGTFTFSNLKSGTKYTFAVRAVIKTSAGNVRSGYQEVAVTIK